MLRNGLLGGHGARRIGPDGISLTQRGTEKGIRVHRKGADGAVLLVEPQLTDPVQPQDVIFVRESLF